MKSQATSNLVTRGVVAVLIAGGIVGHAFATQPIDIAAEPVDPIRSRFVNFADLNLKSPAGVAALYQRIHRAAKQMCEIQTGDPRTLELRSIERQCTDASEVRAINDVHNDALMAYRTKKIGPHSTLLASNGAK